MAFKSGRFLFDQLRILFDLLVDSIDVLDLIEEFSVDSTKLLSIDLILLSCEHRDNLLNMLMLSWKNSLLETC